MHPDSQPKVEAKAKSERVEKRTGFFKGTGDAKSAKHSDLPRNLFVILARLLAQTITEGKVCGENLQLLPSTKASDTGALAYRAAKVVDHKLDYWWCEDYEKLGIANGAPVSGAKQERMDGHSCVTDHANLCHDVDSGEAQEGLDPPANYGRVVARDLLEFSDEDKRICSYLL